MTDERVPRHSAASEDDLPRGSRAGRVLTLIGVGLLGAALATAGWAGWYKWGRTTGPTSLAAEHFTNSNSGMKVTSCQVNAAGTEALASGVFTNAAPATGQIVFEVLGPNNKVFGTATQNVNVSGGGEAWSLQVHLLQGFGAPKVCEVGIF